MLQRIQCESREQWLEARQIQGIGGSEAAAIVGISPWMTATDLWKLKVGFTAPKDLSGNDAVQRGVRLEPTIREFYKAIHPEMTVEYHPFDLLFQKERPWLFATLDGELTDGEGRKGILEVKTGTTRAWQEWRDGAAPRHYIAQATHQLLATDWDFVVIVAVLFSQSGDLQLLERELWKEDCREGMAELLEFEERFMVSVRTRSLPPQPLRMRM